MKAKVVKRRKSRKQSVWRRERVVVKEKRECFCCEHGEIRELSVLSPVSDVQKAFRCGRGNWT